MFWDEYTASVSRRANKWAASDRGWCFTDEGVSVGNYLCYAQFRDEEFIAKNGRIHAVRRRDLSVKWCRTVEEAKLFIEG